MVSFFKKRRERRAAKKAPAPTQSIPRQVSGPIQPGTDAATFRSGGGSVQVQSVPSRSGGGTSISGPLPQGTTAAQEAAFRTTGVTPSLSQQVSAPSARTISSQLKSPDTKDFGDPTLQTRRPITRTPTAREEVFQQSFEQPTTRIGRIKTKKSFEEGIFFGSLLSQQREFEALSPEQAKAKVGVDPRFVGMSTEKGEFISFQPDISSAEQKVQQKFAELPRGQKGLLRLGEVGFGAGKFVVDIGSFTGDVLSLAGQQKLESSKDIKFFDTSVFGRTKAGLVEKSAFIRDIEQKEIGAIGRGTQIGLGVGTLIFGGVAGLRGAKALTKAGFTRREVIAETAGLFSPIRPKPGIFVAKIPTEPEVAFVSTVKTRGGIKQRDITGFGKGFDFTSRQIITKLPSGKVSVGVARTTITQPATRIGGGSVREGTIITKTEGFLNLPKGFGDVSLVSPRGEGISVRAKQEELIGSVAGALTRPKIQAFIEPTPTGLRGIVRGFDPSRFIVGRGAGAGRKVTDSLTGIVAGRRKVIPKTQFLDGAIIREPAGVFSFKPRTRGFEIDLDKAFVSKGVKVIRSRGGKKTPLSKTFGEQIQVQEPVIDTQLRTGQLTSIETSLGKVTSFKIKSENIGVVQIPKQSQRDIVSQQLISKQIIETKTKVKEKGLLNIIAPLGSSGKSIEKSLQRSFQDLTQIPIQKELLGQLPKQLQQPKQKQRLKQRQQQKQLQRQVPLTIEPFADFGDFFGGFDFGIPFILPKRPRLGGEKEKKKPKKRAKSKIRIAPSFTGIVLGIEAAPEISERFGVLPGQIRGLETGRKKKKKKR